LEQWLNASVFGLGLAAAAWAVARPRLFDAAWRGRIWGAALVGLAVLGAWPLFSGNHVASATGPRPGIAIAVPGSSGPARPDGVAAALIHVPAVPVPAALLLAAWGSVAIWRAGALALAVARIRAARAASRPFPDTRTARLPEWAAANAGRFALVLSDRVPAPAMLGFGRPIIAVPPAWLDGLTDEALDAVLLHELAHAERHDDLFDLAQQLLLAASWVHPAAWWMAERIAFEREAACDERAARLTTTRRYARCLLTIATRMQDGGWDSSALVASSVGRRRQVARRVERLLATSVRERSVRSSYMAAPAVAAIVALAAAAPALPRVFDVTAAESPTLELHAIPDRAPGPRAGAEREPGPLALARTTAQPGRASREGGEPGAAPQGHAKPERRPADDTAPAASRSRAADGGAGEAGAGETALASREWSGHLAPAATPASGTAQDNVGGMAEAAAPFRKLGAAIGRAGAGTGRWFSRAGESVATGAAFR
jgi:beta-lactamase regulating signal transducer with metallopeptidase domain